MQVLLVYLKDSGYLKALTVGRGITLKRIFNTQDVKAWSELILHLKRQMARSCKRDNKTSASVMRGKFLDYLRNC
jgi:hypothetical protein